MRSDLKLRWSQVMAAAAVVAGIAVLVPTVLADSANPCCFGNNNYEGTCKVTPGEGETCQSILAYLNNPMSTGKSYCGGTSVRGSWVQVDCKTGKSVIQKISAKATTKVRKPAPTPEEGESK